MVVPLDEQQERLVKMQLAQQRTMLSFSRGTINTQGMMQGETSRVTEIFPLKIPNRE